ncbi:MAG: PglZ domain-containing protein, partial [Myxococcales bacterium]|nr:PglZ domain-containing protein [Myxococcales bacterium]
VDAMRYEMGQRLVEHIGPQAASRVQLSPRLAELPSITAVGMNALVPTSQRGKLHPLFDKRRIDGFDAGGFKVRTPAQRKIILDRRTGSAGWLELDEVLAGGPKLKRELKQRLVVIHSIQIDKAGETGSGLVEFPRELRRIHMAWEQLRAAGVRCFVFTSDHGFLLRRTDDDVIQHGKGYDPQARSVVYPQAVSNAEQLGLRLRDLGYEGSDEALQMPRGLAVFQPARERTFVHGGNSPQERVIPVLTVVHKQAVGGEDQHDRVELSTDCSGAGSHGGGGSHELVAAVVRADNQTTLALDIEPVELELRAADGQGVIAEVIGCEGAKLDAGLIIAPVGQPFTLRFRLRSREEQRVRVELYGASAKRRVDPGVSLARYTAFAPTVSGAFPVVPAAEQPTAEQQAAPTQAPPSASSWLDELEDPSERRVMAHIAEHGQVSEADLIRLLGNARKARQFARRFDALRERAPFLLESTTVPSGKVYRRISDK